MPPTSGRYSALPGARVGPHDAVGAATQPGHLPTELGGVPRLPPVADDEHDGAARQPAAVQVEEPFQRVADAGAAGPVGGEARRPVQRDRRCRARQCPGEPGQPGGEREDLRPVGAGRAVEQLEERAGVGLHRARDVAEHHESARPAPRRPPGESDRITAGAPGLAQRPAQVDVRAVRGPAGAADAPQRCGDAEPPHRGGEQGELLGLRASKSRSARRSAADATAATAISRVGPSAHPPCRPGRGAPPPVSPATVSPPDDRRSGWYGSATSGGAAWSPRRAASTRPPNTAANTRWSTGSCAGSDTSVAWAQA